MNINYIQNIKISVLEEIDKFISEEAEKFNVSKNKYLAEIFTNFDFKYIPNTQTRVKIYKENTKSIQFAVPKNGREKYEKLEKEKIVIADYCRQMLNKFLFLSKVKREQIILHSKLEVIREAIENDMRLNFTTKNGTDMVEPYRIIESFKYDKNYIICYRESMDGVVSYSLENIIKITKRKDSQEYYYEDIDKVDNDFDPFLSYDILVKIRISPEGEKRFQKKKQFCPKILKKQGNIWELECSIFKAGLFFAEFLDEVEILEPESLRKKFTEKVNKMYEFYNKK